MLNLPISQLFLILRSIGNALAFGGFHLPQTILRRLFRLAKSKVVVTNFDGNLQMHLSLSDHMQRRIFWMGYYSREIVALLKKCIKPGMTVLDVGANIGEISLVAANLVGNDGKVIAYEPVTSIADKLQTHVSLNDLTQIQVQRVGLSSKNQTNVPIYGSCGQDVKDDHNGLASLFGQNKDEAIVEYINITTIDDSVASLGLSNIDLIKIDIEGGEYECLLGAEKILKKYRPMLVVEVQEFSAQQAGWKPEELFRFLENFNYEFFTIKNNGNLVRLDRNQALTFQNIFCKATVN